MVNRNLITPIINQKNKNELKLQNMVNNTNKKDAIFYEYEIVDKKKEDKLARKQTRYYGLCLCTRWFFLLAGNAILISIICSVCAILLYVNTSVAFGTKPLTYGQACVNGSTICDTLKGLTCVSSLCMCFSNKVWNGTDCVCQSNQYWDGLACLTNQGYQQQCSSNLLCFSTFNCDPKTSTCLCQSNSTLYYTKFYTGTIDDLYGYMGGVCTDKYDYAASCSAYGIDSCKEYLGLTCAMGSLNNLQCLCNSGYYWNGTYCVPKISLEGLSCALNTLDACSSNISLICNTTLNQCQCSNPSNYYFNTNTNICTLKGSYMSGCLANSWCNTTIGLSCYTGGTPCNCPISSSNYFCDWFYWDGQKCSSRLSINSSCPGSYACISPSTCIFGYCT